jgi:SAM-dependent methyltransferase
MPTPSAPIAAFSPASERNRGPIAQALQRVLGPTGQALEIASGTGQHVAYFAQQLPAWRWQPSDRTADGFDDIQAWCAHAGVRNVAAPVVLDASAARWPSDGPAYADGSLDANFCANMLHIAPWSAGLGLLRGAARYLAPQGRLVTYGPYLEADVPTAPSNLAFDASLRQRDPDWGIRALADVVAAAADGGLRLLERVAMPANNLLLVFGRM